MKTLIIKTTDISDFFSIQQIDDLPNSEHRTIEYMSCEEAKQINPKDYPDTKIFIAIDEESVDIFGYPAGVTIIRPKTTRICHETPKGNEVETFSFHNKFEIIQ